MIVIPEAFRAYRQFINWALIDKGGPKPDKVPIDGVTGRAIDPTDPSNWHTADEVLSNGLGVGFVFTEQDPFFFLDIDNALLPGNQWSQMAQTLCATMSGCFVEISQSGTGLHIFGSGIYPAHACRNKAENLEFYTAGRFVALTGTSAMGNAAFCPQSSIDWVCANYFPGDNDGVVGEWTTAPCDDWHGIVDDAELIAKMLASKSKGSAFGGKATIADLWGGNTDWHNGDKSATDAALCQHLAFWTGKDCARMDILFRQSALMRDKWDEQRGLHPYGVKTILKAVSMCRKVYGERAPVVLDAGVGKREGFQFMSIDQQVEWFKGCYYVTDLHRIFTPDGSFLKPDQFKVVYGGWLFALDNIGDKTSPCAFTTFTQSMGYNFPKVRTTCFRPDLPEMSIIDGTLNTYITLPVTRAAGDAAPFLHHLSRMLPDQRDRDILISWMASVVQNPGKKIPWFPVIQGAQGNGKSMCIMSVMKHAIHRRYYHTLGAQSLGKNGLDFNAWIKNKLLILIEEIYVPKKRWEIMEALKTYITENEIEIQAKGIDQVSGDNCANFIATTNHKDGLLKTANDRRVCVFFTKQQNNDDVVAEGWKGTAYFPTLHKWFEGGGYAVVAEYLHSYAVADELNPFVLAHTAPDTSCTAEAIEISRGGIEQEILEAVESGRVGFISPWISSAAIDNLLRENKQSLTYSKRAEILESLGYVRHPSLKDGRSPALIPSEGCKPRLFVLKQNSIAMAILKERVVESYMKAQSSGGAFGGGLKQARQ